jgi:hypothetical protein
LSGVVVNGPDVAERKHFKGGHRAPAVSARLSEPMSNNIVILQGRFEIAAAPETISLGSGTSTFLLRAWVSPTSRYWAANTWC